MNTEPVIIEVWNPAWAETFQKEQQRLHDIFAPCPVTIEHIGSTAVPGLAAKPVIDIMLGAPNLEAIEERIETLTSAGYQYISVFEDQLPQRRFFILEHNGTRAVHLHAVVKSSPFWHSHLAFRDILRSNPDIRQQYENLKTELAALHRDDREAYCDAKADFIQRVLTTFKDKTIAENAS